MQPKQGDKAEIGGTGSIAFSIHHTVGQKIKSLDQKTREIK